MEIFKWTISGSSLLERVGHPFCITLLVVVTLITAVTFQAGLSPAGGFWQDDEKDHSAGNAIMADKHPRMYWFFRTTNWLGFYISVLLIIWIMAGVDLQSIRIKLSFAFCISMLVLNFLCSIPNYSITIACGAGLFLLIFAYGTLFYDDRTKRREKHQEMQQQQHQEMLQQQPQA